MGRFNEIIEFLEDVCNTCGADECEDTCRVWFVREVLDGSNDPEWVRELIHRAEERIQENGGMNLEKEFWELYTRWVKRLHG